jgi:NitT/TauT family transport system permease protein
VTTLAHAVPRRSSAFVARRLRSWLPAIVVFGLGLVAWQWLLPWLGIERFLLPPFWDVVTTFWDERDELLKGGWITFKEAMAGFALGCSVAFVSALVLARWTRLGRALMPYLIAANAIPIIAFAPITNAWFGILSPWSKIMIAAVLCFFPVLVNTLRGLTSVRPESIELMRSYAASQTTVFTRLRIPASLPYVFASLKVAAVLAMIGAVVGDYFGGEIDALGVQILSAVSQAQYETAWAAILVASVLGLAFYAFVAVIERLALGWHPAIRGAAE